MELVTMSTQELDRAEVLQRVVEGRLSRRLAAKQLGLSRRQVQRLVKRYEQDGAAGLAHRARGRRSNRRLPDELREVALAVVRSSYADFGPTLACEKLGKVNLPVYVRISGSASPPLLAYVAHEGEALDEPPMERAA